MTVILASNFNEVKIEKVRRIQCSSNKIELYFWEQNAKCGKISTYLTSIWSIKQITD